MKRSKIYKYIIPLLVGSLLLLFDRCVEPFLPDLDQNDTVNLLVVEGLITDEPGAFGVRLSSTTPVYSYWNYVNDYVPVSGAEVQIIDDRGNTFLLFETTPGWYETEEKDLQGTPGYTYTLLVNTLDGKQYQSSPVLMLDGPDIKQVHYNQVQRTHFDELTVYEENWLNIMVDTRAPGENIAYYKWDFEETWEFEMPGYIVVSHGDDEGDPPPTWETVEIDWVKKYCWTTEYSSAILVKSTIDDPANEINDFILQSIGPPDDRLNKKYSILVKQYVLSRDMYNFFKRLRESNEETGGIYEKTPAQIIGNIECCNEADVALGYFMASAAKSKRIFIDRTKHSIADGTAFGGCGWESKRLRYFTQYIYGTFDGGSRNVYSTNKYCTDCRVRGTNEMPDFWE